MATHQEKAVKAVTKEGVAAAKSLIVGEGLQADGEAAYYDNRLAGRIDRI